MIDFRELREDELSQLMAQNIQTLADGYARARNVEPEYLRAFFERQVASLVREAWGSKDNHFLAIVECDAQDVVGSLWYRLHEEGVLSDLAFLCWLGIYDGYRGRGYGRAALGKWIENMKAQGIKRAALEAFSERDPAMNLYQSFGFSSVRVLLHRFL
jgi:ribosomal protein S18 acetylase RimI-like enzyme